MHSRIKFDPFFSSKGLGKALDEVFNKGLNDIIGSDFSLHTPAVNVLESDQGFKLELAAPGLTKNEIDIQLDKNKLTISANKNEDADTGAEVKYRRREFNYTSFKRSFTIPNTVDMSKIAASFENGILYLNIPKKEIVKQEATKISID